MYIYRDMTACAYNCPYIDLPKVPQTDQATMLVPPVASGYNPIGNTHTYHT